MSVNIRYPSITGITEKEQLTQIRSFLHQLVEQLNYALTTLGTDGGSTQAASPQAYEVQGGEMAYSELMALIIQELQKLGGLMDSHVIDKSNPHSVTAAQVGATPASHAVDKNNPHSVTKEQVGLGNVPNVATNDQTPSFTEASALGPMVSGETLSAAFGKIAKAITDLISHIENQANPHGVTAEQVGAAPADYSVFDLLWSNPSQASGFAAQTLSVDTSAYNYLAIEVSYNEKDLNGSKVHFVGMRKSVNTVVTLTANLITSSGSRNTVWRKLTVNSNRLSIVVGGGIGADGSENNNNAIPIKIYGVKGV